MSGTEQRNSERGYILLYVMLAITLFAIVASSVVKSTVEEVELGAQELNAVKAQAAADTALECISYWARQPTFPFNSNTPASNFNCNTGGGPDATFTSFNAPQSYCIEQGPVDFTIPNLQNGSCATVSVHVKPLWATVVFPPGPSNRTPLCAVQIKSVGYDDCTAGVGSAQSSRTRWETIGGWSESGNIVSTYVPNATVIGSSTDANGLRLQTLVDPYAVLQVEVSGVATTRHESNGVAVTPNKFGALPTLPYVPADAEVIVYRLVDASTLPSLEAEFDDGDSTPWRTQFNSSDPTTLRISLPGNATVGFHRIVIRANYGLDVYEDAVVYVNVTRAGRGQE